MKTLKLIALLLLASPTAYSMKKDQKSIQSDQASTEPQFYTEFTGLKPFLSKS